MNDITIYHNPACGTSRNVLALIRNTGEEPTVIEYLKTPPDRATLKRLIAAMGVSARDVMRQKETAYAQLGLGDPKWTDEQLIDFMLAHPILIQRPIVVTPIATRLCRPSEAVLDILPRPQQGAFSKEDGEAVVDAEGRRVAMTSPYTSIAEQLRRGGVIGYPTESVFGLGCDPHDAAAVARVFELKQRDPGQGFLLIAADLQQIARYIDAAQVPADVRARIESGWPGPSTWIFPASREVPAWISGRHTGIAVRVTAHGPAAALCRAFGGALVSTSANPHGLPPARTAAEVEAYFPGQLAAVLDEPVGDLAQPTSIRDALTGQVVRA